MSDRLAVIQSTESVRELKDIKNAIKDLIPAINDLKKNVTSLNRGFQSGKPKEYTASLKELKEVTKQLSSVDKELISSMERLANIERTNAQAAAENARARKENALAIKEESKAKEQLAREARNEEKVLKDNNSAHKRLTKEVKEARQKARDYGAEIIALNRAKKNDSITTADFSRKMAQLSKDFNKSKKEANDLQRQLSKLNKETTPSSIRSGALPGRVTDILKSFGIITSIDNIASAFLRLGESAVQTSIKLNSLRLAQKSVFKTNDEVSRQNEFLTTIANKYGVEILSLTDAYTKFAASAQGTYLEGNRTQQIFDAVSRSSALLGVTTDETSGILRALGQMMSKGKVQAEELRGQLGDRMAGAFKLFADGMGISTSQLDKMLKKGEVLADDVLPKFAEQLNKKYKLDLDKQIDTQTASINRRTNAWVNFVDSVNSGSGVLTKGVLGFNAALTNMLEALTPSKKVTIIEQEQAKLNLLGYELRKNFSDEKKRKEIIDEMISINPFFIQGLDKENFTLDQISQQLRNVNDQYIQKIALEKQQEKIKELVEDQAQAYIYLNDVFVRNAVAYNNLNEATKKTLDDFRNGSIGYWDAQKRIEKSTKSLSKENRVATDMLTEMNTIIAQGSLNFDGFNRGIDGNRIAIKNATAAYDSLVQMFDKMAGRQQQLVYMNGLTAKSFNSLGQEQKNQWKETSELLKKAELEGNRFALVRNVWRAQNDRGGWFTTNKKGDDWYLENGKLLERKKAVIEKDAVKQKAATLTAAQKDFVNTAAGIRDTEIAMAKERRLNLKISEEQYWKEYENIIERYSVKIQNYLKGKNAKEIQVEGAAYKKAVDAREQAVKEVYGIRTKALEEQNKIELNISERQQKSISENQYSNDLDKLNAQIEINDKIIGQLEIYYDKQINLARNAGESTLEWERKRDAEIGNIEDERIKNINSIPEALAKQVEYESAILVANKGVTYEQQRQIILKNKSLNVDERDYQLGILEKKNEIELNKSEIAKTQALKNQILLRIQIAKLNFGVGVPTSEEIKQLNEYEEIIKRLESENISIEIDIASTLSPAMQKTKAFVSEGLKNLGLENLSAQFDDVFQKIVDGSFSAKEAVLLTAGAISDGLTAINNKQKENTIKALDEQLKYTQETTEQEIGFINDRLNQLNSLNELSSEQETERRRLEDEARTLKEQQLQREKMIEAQKARAEQKAAAQQALINGALGATQALATMPPPASYVMAALSLGFGVAQAVSISSKNPVPQYFVGREGGKAEWAWTQEKGREIITDKSGNIKSLGSNKGAEMTWLEQGDKVFTAEKSNKILERMYGLPKMGENVFRRIALKSIGNVQMPVVVNQNNINLDELADKMAQKMDKVFHKYSHTSITRANGFIYQQRGANNMEVIGTYDPKTLEENYKK